MSEGFCIRTRLESDAQGNSETAYCFGFNKSIEAWITLLEVQVQVIPFKFTITNYKKVS